RVAPVAAPGKYEACRAWRSARNRRFLARAAQALQQGIVPVRQTHLPFALQARAVQARVERPTSRGRVGARWNRHEACAGFALLAQLRGDGLGEAEPGSLALAGQVIGAPGTSAAFAPVVDQLGAGLGDAAGPGRSADLVGHHAQLL